MSPEVLPGSRPTGTDELPRGRFPIRFLVYGVLAAVALAIGIPSFLRARMSPGEAPHVGQVRTMMSAQAAYQGANRGFYDHPRCLVRPQDCIPGYPAAAPTYLDSSFLQEVRYGYRWTFHAGPAPPDEAIRGGRASPSSLDAWAYVGQPESKQAGRRAYCADSTGRLCFTSDGLPPPVEAAACARGPRCRTLQ